MSTPTIYKVLEIIEAAPHSAQSLTLYALVNTLEYPAAGYLFKLDKLRNLDAEGRRLAYALMEDMAEGQPLDDDWHQAKQQMDKLIRNA